MGNDFRSCRRGRIPALRKKERIERAATMVELAEVKLLVSQDHLYQTLNVQCYNDEFFTSSGTFLPRQR